MTAKNNKNSTQVATTTTAAKSKPPVKTGGKPTKPKYQVEQPAEKQYSFVSPKGTVFTTTNLAAFSRRFNLDRSGLSRVASGQRSNHKNWTLQQA